MDNTLIGFLDLEEELYGNIQQSPLLPTVVETAIPLIPLATAETLGGIKLGDDFYTENSKLMLRKESLLSSIFKSSNEINKISLKDDLTLEVNGVSIDRVYDADGVEVFLNANY